MTKCTECGKEVSDEDVTTLKVNGEVVKAFCDECFDNVLSNDSFFGLIEDNRCQDT